MLVEGNINDRTEADRTVSKDGLWVNCRLSDRANNPYAASLIENLRHWLDKGLDQ